ncbi:MAG: FtsQ-type POTRA domain-containing protein [Holosporaceae bacterium]|jgi:cell division protein FtsQ|nr:FtsQ-type POTRA domain-containing protein [Holosporaceae bacterium]
MGDNTSGNQKEVIGKAVRRYLIVIIRSNLFLLIAFTGITYGVFYFYYDRVIKSSSSVFCIKRIEFDGNERVKDVLLLKASGLKYKSNIFAVSIREVKKKLENIAWIRSVVVQRKFPNKIYIRVAERTPIAILQSKYKLYLIDADGKILENDGVVDFSNLPIVMGEGAEREADRLLCRLDKFPKIRSQLVFAVRLSKRRWNLKINRGITVKLPEKGINHAIEVLDEISDGNGFFNRDISIIDLRMLDRVIVTKKRSNDHENG